jgi:ABC-type lipoprotein export system ATPase subunit
MLGRLLADFPEKTLICVSHRRQVATLFDRRIEVKRGGFVRMIEEPK